MEKKVNIVDGSWTVWLSLVACPALRNEVCIVSIQLFSTFLKIEENLLAKISLRKSC